MLGWVKIYYNDRWWWPRPPHNIGLFCMMVLKVYCVTQKECVWVRRRWDIIIALLKLRLRSQSVFLFLSSWFLFCFSFINCHFFPHLFDTFPFLIFLYMNLSPLLEHKTSQIFPRYFLRLQEDRKLLLDFRHKNFTHGSICSKCSCFSFSTKYKFQASVWRKTIQVNWLVALERDMCKWCFLLSIIEK